MSYDIMNLSALELSGALVRKEISAADVMRATLDRIDAVNGSINAIVSLRDQKTLMAEAHAADNSERRGWLHGIPMAIKELVNVKGMPTRKGSPLTSDSLVQADDIVVSRLREAGAIFIGKTNTPEFGFGSHSFNPVFGATRNPYDLSRSAGGSSGGAGAALAAHMVAVADGSDMMGSLRNPAAWNNVYGMRPTWGLVPSEPDGDTFMHQLATNGPMARCPSDLAALLETIAGPDPRQPHGISQPPSLPQIEGGAKGMRIGWLQDWGGALPMESGILSLCEIALGRMEGLGAQVESLGAPFDRDAMWDSWITLRSFSIAGGLAAVYADKAKRAQMKESAQWEVAQGLSLSAMDVHNASVTRSNWFTVAASLFERFDFLALPAAQMWPFDVTIDWPREVAGVAMDTYHRWMEVVIPASLIGLPAVCVPIGFGGPDNLPMGLQLIGRRGTDAQLLRLAEAWHSETGWPNARPPVL